MRELNWQITKFNSIHSYPADIPEGAEMLNQDMANLRINRWGHLRPRPAVDVLDVTAAPDGVTITGVASRPGEIYWLRSDGKLFIDHDNPPAPRPQEILGRNNVALGGLSGRLSLANFNRFAIITSEGTDNGYVIWTPEPAGSHTIAEPLGIDAPDIEAQIKESSTVVTPSDDLDHYVFYKITYIANDISGTIESPASERLVIDVPEEPLTVSLGFGEIPASVDERVVRIYLYRSRLYDTDVVAAENVDDEDVDYFRIEPTLGAREFDGIPRDQLAGFPLGNRGVLDESYQDGLPAIPLDDNTHLPSEIKQITEYNGRLFAPNANELRYSDVRDGIPFWSAWPAGNSLHTGARITFAAEYQSFLLFGGQDGLYVLTGDSKYNFQIRQISARGPISPHAHGVLSQVFGYVGIDDIYMTDGAQVIDTGSPLKGYLNHYQIEDGLVAQLPSETTIWSMRRRNSDGADTLTFINDKGKWTRIAAADGHPPTQIANADDAQTVIADDYRVPRILNWILSDEYEDDATMPDATEAINWKWESQELAWDEQGAGERMKNFKWLEISGLANPPEITATFYIDDKAPIVVNKNLDRELTDKFRPLRIRINRWGFGLRFTIEGAGDITLRGLKLMIHT